MKNNSSAVTIAIVAILLAMAVGGCFDSLTVHPVSTIKNTGVGVINSVKNIETGCTVDATSKLTCEFANGTAAAVAADEAAYQACVAKYRAPVEANWSVMSKFERLQIGMTIIAECTP